MPTYVSVFDRYVFHFNVVCKREINDKHRNLHGIHNMVIKSSTIVNNYQSEVRKTLLTLTIQYTFNAIQYVQWIDVQPSLFYHSHTDIIPSSIRPFYLCYVHQFGMPSTHFSCPILR